MNRYPQRLMLGLFTMLLAVAPNLVSADVEDFGAYQVQYNIFPSTFLRPSIAAQYKLTRSRAIGVINVSIQKKADDGSLQTVSGQIEGQVSNDIQQTDFLAFRQINEGDAVYYIAQFAYRSGELQTFNVTVRPSGSQSDLAVRQAKTLFND
ncbi:MAG: DUF4426 domain-containing protein [Marinobacter sp.]|nr:DUF4426 domain-containing protein [Marinobacter sp.]